jgi:hypothetical protein
MSKMQKLQQKAYGLYLSSSISVNSIGEAGTLPCNTLEARVIPLLIAVFEQDMLVRPNNCMNILPLLEMYTMC